MVRVLDTAMGILQRASQTEIGLVVLTTGNPYVALQSLYRARKACGVAFADFTFHRKDPEIWILKTGARQPEKAAAQVEADKVARRRPGQHQLAR